MLVLLALLILGIVWVALALIDNDAASMESLYGRRLLVVTTLRMGAILWNILSDIFIVLCIVYPWC